MSGCHFKVTKLDSLVVRVPPSKIFIWIWALLKEKEFDLEFTNNNHRSCQQQMVVKHQRLLLCIFILSQTLSMDEDNQNTGCRLRSGVIIVMIHSILWWWINAIIWAKKKKSLGNSINTIEEIQYQKNIEKAQRATYKADIRMWYHSKDAMCIIIDWQENYCMNAGIVATAEIFIKNCWCLLWVWLFIVH